ncbi:shikimate dehydrogenase [Candidatus Cyanaurora vandensis]|uniref:shikimate dehydrogenase n=1 Tax=Candidatus Cyanaurora vandensis TaxID=2714958 RepID=UPI00257AADEA|nr:shikimate dehydrogenase [Candidatus Cyanaurora vandensis]
MSPFLGLVGDPVGHSLSPVMHNAALAHLAWAWVYLPFQVPSAELEAAVRGLWSLGCRGFNVTIPHKQTVIPYLAGLSEAAMKLGAVNTVVRTPAGWWGENTDYLGFVAPLKTLIQREHALILGSGGAARAAIYGCQQLGFSSMTVWGRNSAALQQLQRDFPTIQPLTVLTPAVLNRTSLVANSTPFGMAGHPQALASPLTDLEMNLLPANCWVYDLVYTPSITPLLQQASQRGLRIEGGLGMLVEQAAQALTLWTQTPAPTELMRTAAAHQLQLTKTDLAGPVIAPESPARPS